MDQRHGDDHRAVDDPSAGFGIRITDGMLASREITHTPATIPT